MTERPITKYETFTFLMVMASIVALMFAVPTTFVSTFLWAFGFDRFGTIALWSLGVGVTSIITGILGLYLDSRT